MGGGVGGTHLLELGIKPRHLPVDKIVSLVDQLQPMRWGGVPVSEELTKPRPVSHGFEWLPHSLLVGERKRGALLGADCPQPLGLDRLGAGAALFDALRIEQGMWRLVRDSRRAGWQAAAQGLLLAHCAGSLIRALLRGLEAGVELARCRERALDRHLYARYRLHRALRRKVSGKRQPSHQHCAHFGVLARPHLGRLRQVARWKLPATGQGESARRVPPPTVAV